MQMEVGKKFRKQFIAKEAQYLIHPAPGFLQDAEAFLKNQLEAGERTKVKISSNHIILKGVSLKHLPALLVQANLFQQWDLILYQNKTQNPLEDLSQETLRKKLALLGPISGIKISLEPYNRELESEIRDLLENTLTTDKDAEGMFYCEHGPFGLRLRVDVSGAALYKRGYRKDIRHAAPLREDIAAAILYQARRFHGFKEADLFIPFSGTGTFLWEYLLLDRMVDQSGFERSYSLTRHFPELEKTMHFEQGRVKNSFLNYALLVDWNEHAVSESEKILSEQFFGISENTQILKEDVFQLDWIQQVDHMKSKNIFIPLHPPYGKRLTADVNNLYNRIALKAASLMNYDRKQISGVLLCPNESVWKSSISLLKAKEIQTTHSSQGGEHIRILHFKNYS
jgi:hypothetical protein